MDEYVRDLPEPERGPLSWEDVEALRGSRLWQLAEIAERYVLARERRERRWRWLKRLIGRAA